MALIEKHVYDIPMDQLVTAEGFALESLQMPKERVMDRYADPYNSTLERCLKDLECKGLCASFVVESRDDGAIHLEGGIVLKSKLLPEVMRHADEIVVYAVVVTGHDELMADPDNSMFENMFYNAWGAGYSMSAHRWFKRYIKELAQERGRFAGRGWTPGEDNIEMSLQPALFELIDPGQIGISLLADGSMLPVMSLSGLMGIGSDPAIEEVGVDASE